MEVSQAPSSPSIVLTGGNKGLIFADLVCRMRANGTHVGYHLASCQGGLLLRQQWHCQPCLYSGRDTILDTQRCEGLVAACGETGVASSWSGAGYCELWNTLSAEVMHLIPLSDSYHQKV
jgi:hypothetical protein